MKSIRYLIRGNSATHMLLSYSCTMRPRLMKFMLNLGMWCWGMLEICTKAILWGMSG